MGSKKVRYDKKITLTLSDDHWNRFDELCDRFYTDKSKLLRKWIDQENPPLCV